MDNLCHTLAGTALAQAGLKRRTAFGTTALVIASNLPDVDALVFLSGEPSVAFRRGWTHGVLAQALLPIALTAALVAVDRYRARRRGRPPGVRPAAMLALAYAGVLSHVFLDFLNNYGIRLLKPFSDRWFYGDAVFIIDPWLWLVLGIGTAWAHRRKAAAPAQVALAIAALYIAGMMVLASASRRIVLDAWTMARGAGPRQLMVGPAPFNPFSKRVIVDTGDRYETGEFHWWPRSVRFDPRAIPINANTPEARAARQDPDVRAILVWARFPYYEVQTTPDGPVVVLRDMRFGDNVGSTRVPIDP